MPVVLKFLERVSITSAADYGTDGWRRATSSISSRGESTRPSRRVSSLHQTQIGSRLSYIESEQRRSTVTFERESRLELAWMTLESWLLSPGCGPAGGEEASDRRAGKPAKGPGGVKASLLINSILNSSSSHFSILTFSFSPTSSS